MTVSAFHSRIQEFSSGIEFGGPSSVLTFFIVVFLVISIFNRSGLTLILQGFSLCSDLHRLGCELMYLVVEKLL